VETSYQSGSASWVIGHGIGFFNILNSNYEKKTRICAAEVEGTVCGPQCVRASGRLAQHAQAASGHNGTDGQTDRQTECNA